MISTLPTQREVLLHKPISDDLNELDNVKTTVIKSMFCKHKDRWLFYHSKKSYKRQYNQRL